MEKTDKKEVDTFASLISRARRERGMSQRQLGQQIQTPRRPNGVWNTYVGQIEKGDKVPSDEVVIKFAEVLELSPSEALLSAYEARAESTEARSIFRRAERLLREDAIEAMLASGDVRSTELLKNLIESGMDRALTEEAWSSTLARICRVRAANQLKKALGLIQSLEGQQWAAALKALESIQGESRQT